ncbi:recombinase family protein [Rhodococcus sp. IEGM 1318]|uniref:recombinase family protein n=1 Tax=Rhodococcus sp. IEGM 1318 TaxID=3082226 RepID=UPI00295382A4|nr:recombinase family protein [Rhodococcus sp. IEGM 1318]MDV8003861.1 recombinase family protein [Rhodococcus sp. IEGM 1318]
MDKKQAPTRAIIYTRVSKDSAGTGRSVAEQETECRAVCEREGWPVGEVLQDNDIGASRWSGKDRPAYRRLAEVLRPGDVLVTWEASRAQRDLTAYAELRDLCAALGVLWNYKGRTHDLNVGADRFTTGLDALLAEREADEIRDRVLRALEANAAEGKPHGKIAYGYRAVRDPQSGLITAREIDPEAAGWIREMAERVLQGESLRAILKDVNPRAGMKWYSATISKMLRSPTLAGLRTYKGETLPGNWEPILTMDEHKRLVTVLGDPGRRTSYRGTEPRYLVSGIAVCGVCGGPCYVGMNHKKPTYVCRNGGHVSRMVSDVDPVVIDKMIRIINQQRVNVFLFREDDGEGRSTGNESAEWIAKAQLLQGRLDEFSESAATGEISKSEYLKISGSINKQIAEANAKAAETAVNSDPMLELLYREPEEVWESANIDQRRRFIRATVDVRILKTGAGKRFEESSVQVTDIRSNAKSTPTQP